MSLKYFFTLSIVFLGFIFATTQGSAQTGSIGKCCPDGFTLLFEDACCKPGSSQGENGMDSKCCKAAGGEPKGEKCCACPSDNPKCGK